VYGLLYLFGFSTKTKQNCVGEESSWKSVNSWENAHWAEPTIRPLNWTAYAFQNVDISGLRLRFYTKMYKFIVDGTLGADVGIVTSSSALCDFSSTKAILETVTCDCYGGTGDCFSNNQLVPQVVGKNNFFCFFSQFFRSILWGGCGVYLWLFLLLEDLEKEFAVFCVPISYSF
jgi:hypothetical protein